MEKNSSLSLNGTWQLQQDNDPNPFPAEVPGNVHQALLAAEKIPDPYYRENERDLQWIGQSGWTYTRRFELTGEQLAADSVQLFCAGLDTFARVEINGQTAGNADNMFREWTFDVKPYVQAGDNRISIHFDSVLPYIEEKLKVHPVQTTHCIDHEPFGRSWVRKEPCNFGWDWGPVLVTHGIWRDIELRIGAEGRMTGLRLKQSHQDHEVRISGQAEIPVPPAEDVSLTVSVSLEGETVLEQETAPGCYDFEAVIPDPQLWWPNNMGEQPLYEVSVTLNTAEAQTLSKRMGLRTVEVVRDDDEWGQSFYFKVNGVPLFAKGSNWIPADTLHRVTDAHYRDLLQSAADGNQNMIRVWGGAIYEEDVFYDICDERGLLVWQDFMFACAAYPADEPGFKENVQAEVVEQAKRLSSHACLALWCGNNELEMFIMAREGESWPKMPVDLYRNLFDEWIPEALTTVDTDTVYWPCSPHSPTGDRYYHENPACGDAHLWSVWHGDEPFEWYRRSFHRFCSEFGFQSYPEMKTLETCTVKEDWNVTSPVMEFHQRSGVGNAKIIHYMLSWFRMPVGFESTVMLSQLQQGLAIKYAVEHWRLNKPRCMGALYWQLNDCWQVASWASIDYFGRWKTLHYMSKRFFAPLLVAGVEDVETGSVRVHVSSDVNAVKELKLVAVVTDVEGRKLNENTKELSIAALQSREVEALDCSAVISEHGVRRLLVWLELWDGEELVSENLVHFAKPKHLELQDPQLSHSLVQTGDCQFELTLQAEFPALWVTMNLRETDFRATDNAVNLRPGETRTISVRTLSPLTAEAFEAQLQLTSITDYSNYEEGTRFFSE